jgi:hypothetical protein
LILLEQKSAQNPHLLVFTNRQQNPPLLLFTNRQQNPPLPSQIGSKIHPSPSQIGTKSTSHFVVLDGKRGDLLSHLHPIPKQCEIMQLDLAHDPQNHVDIEIFLFSAPAEENFDSKTDHCVRTKNKFVKNLKNLKI